MRALNWLAFEVRDGNSGDGWMPYGSAPYQLADYAASHPLENGWYSTDSSWALGMRISSVPAPATAWLFGTGLLGLISVAKRKKQHRRTK